MRGRRELRRNALDSGGYSASFADGAYMERRQRPAALERDARLATFVRQRLSEGWSPQQISGWLQSGAEAGLRAVTMETIYAFIYLYAASEMGYNVSKPCSGAPLAVAIKR